MYNWNSEWCVCVCFFAGTATSLSWWNISSPWSLLTAALGLPWSVPSTAASLTGRNLCLNWTWRHYCRQTHADCICQKFLTQHYIQRRREEILSLCSPFQEEYEGFSNLSAHTQTVAVYMLQIIRLSCENLIMKMTRLKKNVPLNVFILWHQCQTHSKIWTVLPGSFNKCLSVTALESSRYKHAQLQNKQSILYSSEIITITCPSSVDYENDAVWYYSCLCQATKYSVRM